MDIFEEYNQATETRTQAWWCRERNDSEEKHLKNITAWRCDIIKWRIGWAKTLRACAGTEILDLITNIVDSSWDCTKEKGRQHALRCEYNRKDKKRFPDYRVISFRHAAWLLRWFEGYEEECREPIGNPRNGTKNGKAAVDAYKRLLVDCRWLEDAKLKTLLGIN